LSDRSPPSAKTILTAPFLARFAASQIRCSIFQAALAGIACCTRFISLRYRIEPLGWLRPLRNRFSTFSANWLTAISKNNHLVKHPHRNDRSREAGRIGFRRAPFLAPLGEYCHPLSRDALDHQHCNLIRDPAHRAESQNYVTPQRRLRSLR